ncbi:MAG: universal stress protein [Planctomycetota bacterium]|nr:universal stress protein [Planctomycetota bacterium]
MAKSARASASSKKKSAARSGIATVLCATDLSTSSQHALATAAEIAEAFDAKLVLAHVVELWDSRYDFLVKDLTKRLTEEALERVAQELKHLGKTESVPVEVVIKKGHASTELLKIVKATKADLVVAGSHSKGALDRILLGSVAERLLHASPVSVLISRPGAHADIKRIVAAVDGSATAQSGLDLAVELARREKLDGVTVVNTYEVPTGYLEAGMNYETARDRMKAIHESDLAKALGKRKKDAVKLDVHVEEGPTAETIVKFAQQEDADLIVIGTHGHTALTSFFLGSVAQKVVRASPISVLAVKSAQHRMSILEWLDLA